VPINQIGRALDRRLGLLHRATDDELMDTLPLSEVEVRSTLRWLQFTNRRFGGTRTILRHLSAWTAGWPTDRATHLLDVGTGAADIPAAVVAWARRLGLPIRVTAIDSAASIVAAARAAVRDEPDIFVEQIGLFELAATDRRFDIVTASLFLHHVPPERTRDALEAIDRLAIRGVIVSDLLVTARVGGRRRAGVRHGQSDRPARRAALGAPRVQGPRTLSAGRGRRPAVSARTPRGPLPCQPRRRQGGRRWMRPSSSAPGRRG